MEERLEAAVSQVEVDGKNGIILYMAMKIRL